MVVNDFNVHNNKLPWVSPFITINKLKYGVHLLYLCAFPITDKPNLRIYVATVSARSTHEHVQLIQH